MNGLQIISQCILRVFGYDLVSILPMLVAVLAFILSGKSILGVGGGSCFWDLTVGLFALKPGYWRRMGLVRGWGMGLGGLSLASGADWEVCDAAGWETCGTLGGSASYCRELRDQYD